MKNNQINSRRKFIGTMAATAGLSGLASPVLAYSLSGKRQFKDPTCNGNQ
jgi:hypothetical protein